MTEKGIRIVFMGTPEFAVASLRALYEEGFDIAAVVTAPDRPAGRGRKLTASPVKEYAMEKNIPVLQPEKLRDPGFISQLKTVDATLFVVVAFRMLPEEVWSLPQMGTFNLHASLLPQYRGAAPINHAVINGETITGVTTFMIDREIDTGKILLQQKESILPDDNAGTLHDRLMITGAELVIRTVKGLAAGTLSPASQKVTEDMILRKAPKIYPPDTVINWHNSATKVLNLIRGLSPYPCAVTTIISGTRSIRLKVYSAQTAEKQQGDPGSIITLGNRLLVICGEGCLEILSLQAEGRKRMDSVEFLRGFSLHGWSVDMEDTTVA